MSSAKTRSAKPKARKVERQTSSFAARLAALETRLEQWGPELDAQLAVLARRIETLERRTSAQGAKSDQEAARSDAARNYSLERRVAELEASMKSQP